MLAWRLTHKPPADVAMPGWQATAAHATHHLLYALFFIVPLGLIVMVSFWQATDYELIPAFTLQSYRDIVGNCGQPEDACVMLRTYVSTLELSLLTWAITLVNVATSYASASSELP